MLPQTDCMQTLGVHAHDQPGGRGQAGGDEDADAVEVIEGAVRAEVGEHSVVLTPQSLGGEDFAWYLEKTRGAMARLGTRRPGGPTYDLHQGNLRVDEGATLVAARVLASVAVDALES